MQGYQNNQALALNRAELYQSATSTAISYVNEIRDAIRTVSNDTYNDAQRSAISRDIEGYLKGLLNVANTQDGSGNYIFSGFNNTSPAYVQQNGQYVYQGGYDATSIYISPTVDVPYTESGYDIFSNIYLGNGTFTVTAERMPVPLLLLLAQ